MFACSPDALSAVKFVESGRDDVGEGATKPKQSKEEYPVHGSYSVGMGSLLMLRLKLSGSSSKSYR